MTRQPINIIGAGLGGVTLGRALSNCGVPVVIYERATSGPRHGYGTTLHLSTYKPLLKILNLDERTFRQRVAVDSAIGGNGAIDPKRLLYPRDLTSSSFRAHRGRLESLICQGLKIQWEHGVEKVEQTSNGTSLVFENGQTAQGQDCIIAADGVHSQVRKSTLPKAELNILPFVTFNGKRRVSRDTFDKVFASAMNDTNIIETRNNGILLQVSINDVTEDYVSINWTYSRAAKGTTDPCYKPNRPLSRASDIPSEFYQEISALSDLAQPYKEIFDQQKMKTDRMLSWLMRTSKIELLQLQDLAAQGIFFMGDSVHSQAILGGEGANVAISDALTLAEEIANNGTASIAQWYEKRVPIWQEISATSMKTIEDVHRDRAVL